MELDSALDSFKRHCTRFTGSHRYACSHSSPHA